ncbi:uncharacterized protein LOC122853280 isoform X2 [Aphidius gifuensis]|uniref:uncharacterized protein LOC122853280 isoform X2 n=1 Tax=Aphidius gifuensis TaxID=684658 RepID=UPI001CDBD55D|nr:uncharacterized protein LOC122853280 isoform X2 [Aphidius gifuensis]
MSSIFNLFGSVTPKNQQQIKIDSFRDSTKSIGNKIHENLSNSKLQASNVVVKKQKGLSIRSKVDPNVCTTNTNNVPSKNNQLTKPVFKKAEESLQQIAPIKKKTLSKVPIGEQFVSPAPRSKSPHENTSSSINFTFKKPITPTKLGYPEPEYLIGLKNWTEEQRFYRPSYDDIIQESMFSKCQDKPIVPLDDDDDDYEFIPKAISTSDLSYPTYDLFENEKFKLTNDIGDIEPPKMPSVSD